LGTGAVVLSQNSSSLSSSSSSTSASLSSYLGGLRLAVGGDVIRTRAFFCREVDLEMGQPRFAYLLSSTKTGNHPMMSLKSAVLVLLFILWMLFF
jgi:hypothetical protein